MQLRTKTMIKIGTKIPLNKNIVLIICDKSEAGSMHAVDFEAKSEWVLCTDHGERFATRYTYRTEYCNRKGVYFSCGNPKAAVQQAIVEAIKGSQMKLKDIYFKIASR